MIIKLLISTILVLTLASCGNTRNQDKPKLESPKALEDITSSSEFDSKRSYDDLVESLYNELVSTNTDLKKLENKIDELNKSNKDSTDLFDKYNLKNHSYFSSANRHTSEIKDSLLRDKMRNLISNNLTKYNSSIVKHNELLKIIETKNMTIADLHNILKIVKTMQLVEKYQHDNLPSTKSLEGYIRRQDETIKLADTLTKN